MGSTNPYFQKVFFKKLDFRKEPLFFFLRFPSIFSELLQIEQKVKKIDQP